jgi:predicted acyltransferase
MAGALIMGVKDNHLRIERLGLLGAVILMLGFLWDYAMPINKTLWSSSYVLVTCGLASLLLAVLIWLIDVKGYKSWTMFFETFGVNPMAIFVFAGLFANLISNVGFTTSAGKWMSLKGYLYAEVLSPWFGSTLGSLVFALMFICVCWAVAYPLYRKKIYIKI